MLKKLLNVSKTVFLPGIGVDADYYAQVNLDQEGLAGLKKGINIPDGAIVITYTAAGALALKRTRDRLTWA